MTEKYNGNRIGLEEEKLTGDRYSGLSSKTQEALEESSERQETEGHRGAVPLRVSHAGI